jgi:hypothetical protein
MGWTECMRSSAQRSPRRGGLDGWTRGRDAMGTAGARLQDKHDLCSRSTGSKRDDHTEMSGNKEHQHH